MGWGGIIAAGIAGGAASAQQQGLEEQRERQRIAADERRYAAQLSLDEQRAQIADMRAQRMEEWRTERDGKRQAAAAGTLTERMGIIGKEMYGADSLSKLDDEQYRAVRNRAATETGQFGPSQAALIEGRQGVASTNSDTRRYVADQNNETRRDIATQRNETQRDIQADRSATQMTIAEMRQASASLGRGATKDRATALINSANNTLMTADRLGKQRDPAAEQERQDTIRAATEMRRRAMESINAAGGEPQTGAPQGASRAAAAKPAAGTKASQVDRAADEFAAWKAGRR